MKTLLHLFVCLVWLGCGFPTTLQAAEAAKPGPNVLFCIADDASPHFGTYGCSWAKTPQIDALARHGLRFERAYTPSAKCAPARAAVLTGRNPWQLEEAANHQPYFPAKFTAFTELLAERGFAVGSHGKTWGPGSAKTAAGEPRRFGFAPIAGEAAKGKRTPAGDLRTFLASRQKDQRFFFWFGSSHPHRAYAADAGIKAGKTAAQIEHVPGFWPDNTTIRNDMLDYATEIEALDEQVGSLVAVLRELGELENTVVIVTSDHGMPFPRSKGHTYEISHRVPLVVHWPAGLKQPGRHAQALVSLTDLAPTILDCFGVNVVETPLAPVTGRSFLAQLQHEKAAEAEFLVLGRERHDVRARPGTEAGLGYPSRSLRIGDCLYIHNFAPERWPCGDPELGLKDTDTSPTKAFVEKLGPTNKFWQLCYGKRPAEELYQVVRDADCLHNLAEQADHLELCQRFREQLFTELKRQQDPRILGQGEKFDAYPTARK